MEEDLFDNGIDGEPWDEPADTQIRALEDEYCNGRVIYNDNGIEIAAYPEDGNYVITTNKYQVYWWMGSNCISIYPIISNTLLMSFVKSLDLSLFATVQNDA